MKSHILNGRWIGAFLLVATALCIMPAAPVQAQDEDEPVSGTAFLILSLEQTFNVDTSGKNPKGSATVLVDIGDFFAGDGLYSTRFVADKTVKVKLPNKIKSFSELDGYEFTIVGGFDAPSASVHLVSPEDGIIPPKVQEAFFLASPQLTDEFANTFPSTIDIAQFIYDTAIAENEAYYTTDNGPDDPALSVDLVLQYVFNTDDEPTLSAEEGDVFAEADDDLFPHDPKSGDRLFEFSLLIDQDDGDLDIEMTMDVVMDIKPGNTANVIEGTDQGVVWVAILTTLNPKKNPTDEDSVAFDAATEVDPGTVYLGPNKATVQAYKIEDADHDGHDDIALKFNVEDIGLTSATTSLTLVGQTYADPDDPDVPDSPMYFTATDHVTVK